MTATADSLIKHPHLSRWCHSTNKHIVSKKNCLSNKLFQSYNQSYNKGQ